MSAHAPAVAVRPFLEVFASGVSATHELGAAPLTIGRHPTNTVVLRDVVASRWHCTIERNAGGYRLRDLDSRNGTKLNGRRVEMARLKAGDLIAIGRTYFRFHDPDALPTWELG